MADFNKVILIGRLTRDPELRYTPSGTAVANINLAVNHKYRSGDEMKEDVCFVEVVTFGNQAESVCQHLGKGSGIIVDGRLSQRRWEADDGTKRSKHEIVANHITFMPRSAPVDRDGGSEYDIPPF